MKKQQEKKKIWLLLLAVLITVAVAAAVVLILMGSDEDTVPTATEQGFRDGFDGKLYWNVDRAEYYGKQDSKRPQDDEGRIAVTFAVDGEQIRLLTADRNVANKADSMAVMGLVFDSQGIVVDVLDVEECIGEFAVSGYFVEQIQGNTLVCNNAASFDGYQVKLELEENTKIYRGGSVDLLVGTPTTVSYNDEVIAIRDFDGNLICVYVIPYKEPGDLYWNITRMYDSVTGMTTRQADITGNYIFELAVNGERITVRTRDINIATAIDKVAGKHFGLAFDENGEIIEVITASTVTGGTFFTSWFHVIELNGREYTAEKFATGSDTGQVATGKLSQNCKIFDVSGASGPIGTPVDSLQVGDQVTALTDSRGMVCVIFIISRKMDSEMYWNVERKYDSQNIDTTRVPNAQGEYEILLAVNGTQVTYKCKDRAVVTQMDARADKHFGLKIEDGYITACYTPSQVTGGTYFASWCDVQELDPEGKTVTALRTLDGSNKGKLYCAPIAEDCKIYNVSSIHDSFVGEQTTLRLGDRIHGEMDMKGELKYIYVVNRRVESRMYWNVSRMYNSATKQTTRTPNEEGYYEIVLAVHGKQITVRTKNKALVTEMDARADKHFGLKLSGDVVLEVYTPEEVTGGTYFASWCDVTAVSNNTITAVRTISGSNQGRSYTAEVAPGCEIYDVTGAYKEFCGEPTYVRLGDRIHGEIDYTGRLVVIYVVDNRTVDCPLYWNVERKWDSGNSVSTRQPDADGWYEILLAAQGKQVTLRTQDPQIVHSMDAKADRYFGLTTQGDEIVRYVSADAVTGGSYFASWCDVTDITDGMVTAKRTLAGADQGKDYTAKMAKDCKVYNVSSNYWDFPGEETTLKVGDRIQGQKNKNGELVYIYVVERPTMPEAEHTCQHSEEGEQWYAWNGKADILLPGHYVLTKDMDVTRTTRINANGKVTLCLNGYTVTGTEANGIFAVFSGTEFTLCDHKKADGSYDGTVTTPYTGLSGGVFYIYDGGTVNIRGGNYIHTGTCQMAGIGGVGDNGKGAWLNIYDGSFRGGTATGSGGQFSVYEGGQVTVTGGTFTGGSAYRGGIFYLYPDTTLTVTGATLRGGHATERGGNIGLGKSAFLRLQNCVVEDGTADAEGGNIGADASDITIGARAVIRGGSARNGGNVLTYGKFTMEGGTVEGGNAQNRGGNIYMFASSSSDNAIRGGTVQSGTAAAGGNLWVGSNANTAEPASYAKLEISGGTVQNGNATGSRGGNLCVSNAAQVTVSGDASFKGGTTTNDGASIAISRFDTDTHSVPEVIMKGGTVESATAPGNGGGIWVYKADFTITGGTLRDCHARQGGGVYISGGKLKVGGNALVDRCSATNPGGSVFITAASMDMTGGTLRGGSASEGGNVYISTGADHKVTISDGTIEGGSAKNGGNVVSYGQVDFTGGTIRNGTATSNGGNIQIFRSANCLFTMSGSASISGGSVYCAGVAAESTYGTLVLKGGSLDADLIINTKGKALISGGRVAGTVSLAPAGVLELSEAPGIGTLYLKTDAVATVTGKLTNAEPIAVSMQSPGRFAAAVSEENADRFTSADEAYKVYAMEGKLYLLSKNAHVHCICGGDGKQTHDTCESQVWQAWSDPYDLPKDSGWYYLTTDVELSARVAVNASTQQRLCLNGHTVTGSKDSCIWWVYNYQALTDCQEDPQGRDKGAVQTSANTTGAILNIFTSANPGGTFEMYGGTLRYTGTGATSGGSLIFIGNSGTTYSATFNLYGGTLTGGNTTGSGGAISMHGSLTKVYFNMYGGQITECSGYNGGALNMGNGQTHIYGGSISNCSASNRGGAISQTAGELYIHGGEITGCTSVSYGGSVNNLSGANLYISEDALITSGSGSVGGNLNVEGICTMTGGVIEKGWSLSGDYEGGNVRVLGTFNLQGGTVRDGGVNDKGVTVTKKGGNFQVFGSLNISGGTVSGGKVTNQGGNIAAWGGRVTVSGGTVTGGTAANSGGSIVINAPAGKTGTLTVTGGSITTGDAPVAPCVCLEANATAQISGNGVIGDLYLRTAGRLTLGTFEKGADVGISASAPMVVAQNVTTDPTAYVRATGAGLRLTWEDNTLTLENV